MCTKFKCTPLCTLKSKPDIFQYSNDLLTICYATDLEYFSTSPFSFFFFWGGGGGGSGVNKECLELYFKEDN